ncbi:hypothetical protein SNE40_007682 [Patella caerulea]|uniref:WD repeat-containing protein 89 n=1 Tax=Patella caerulea TaxID=87958 RepID=A0AAN8JZI2_PATCE
MENLAKLLGQLHLTHKSSISLAKTEPEYILAIAAQNQSEDNSSLIAATSSNYSIRLYNKTTLAGARQIQGHNNVITGISFGKEDPNILLSCSRDKTVKCWDLRCKPENEAQQFQGKTDVGFGSVDISCNDRLICAGTDVDFNKDAYLIFWDRRKAAFLGSYSESFDNEIVQVCFHPSKTDHVASGASDGLVCIFNLTETDEDDALITTLNTESFVARIGWCGVDNENIYCITDVDTYHSWDAFEGDLLKEVLDFKDKLKGEDSIDYLIDVILTEDNTQQIIAAGNKTGTIKLLDISSKRTEVISTLSKGHTEIVRCIYYNNKNGTLITGGEDSLLCLWSSDPVTTASSIQRKGKLKMKQTPSRKSQPYSR